MRETHQITPLEVLQKKVQHWLRYAGQYKRLVDEGKTIHEGSLIVAIGVYGELLAELKALADSGNVPAQHFLARMPKSPVELAGPRAL